MGIYRVRIIMKMPAERRYVTGEGDSVFRISYIGDKSDPKSRIVHLREDVAGSGEKSVAGVPCST
jgi:hypothetical protein